MFDSVRDTTEKMMMYDIDHRLWFRLTRKQNLSDAVISCCVFAFETEILQKDECHLLLPKLPFPRCLVVNVVVQEFSLHHLRENNPERQERGPCSCLSPSSDNDVLALSA
jgi:hypothetical protein